MREPLTSMLLAEQLKRLLAAFPTRLASQNPQFLAETYRDGLKGIDGQAFRGAVEMAIQNEQYFPRISKLRELAHEWAKRNRVETPAEHKSTWNRCGVCGAEAAPEMITRPRLFDPESSEPHYRTAKETRFANGLVWAAGHHVPRGGLGWAQLNGVQLETETVEGRRLVMNHKPGPHHVTVGRMEDVA